MCVWFVLTQGCQKQASTKIIMWCERIKYIILRRVKETPMKTQWRWGWRSHSSLLVMLIFQSGLHGWMKEAGLAWVSYPKSFISMELNPAGHVGILHLNWPNLSGWPQYQVNAGCSLLRITCFWQIDWLNIEWLERTALSKDSWIFARQDHLDVCVWFWVVSLSPLCKCYIC